MTDYEFPDDHIKECSGCLEEACCCPDICHECKLWIKDCICPQPAKDK